MKIENGKTYVFHTTDSELSKYNNTKVSIIRKLTNSECDIEDIGNMYRVQFKDGHENDIFEDELEENKNES